jgi:hypothetical protein
VASKTGGYDFNFLGEKELLASVNSDHWPPTKYPTDEGKAWVPKSFGSACNVCFRSRTESQPLLGAAPLEAVSTSTPRPALC